MKNHAVLVISSGILLMAAIYIFLWTPSFYYYIEVGSIWVRKWFGTFYLWLGLICVLFLLIIAFSPSGKIRFGSSKPEFNRWSWIAMLYSAGMGAGILLRGVQEPVYMYLNNPIATGSKPEVIALEYTFYQWGFTAWAFYTIFALLIGYSVYVQKGSVNLGNSLKVFSRIKLLPHAIDVLTIITTVAGLVAAIGLGTTQIEGGLSHLFSIPAGNLYLTLSLVFLICFIAFISAWNGMKKGIKRISNWNIYLALSLLLFVFVQGNFSQVFLLFLESLYRYLTEFIPLSLAYGNYNPGSEFLTEWTYYYWAFWLAWAPFTGIFIARISKGRTIREMILGVLIFPSLGTFFWFSVFGSASFDFIKEWGTYNNEFSNVFTSIFVFFQNYPLPVIINSLIIVLLISFLVTSVDSAIYVLSMFSSRGREHPKKKFRLIWAVVIFIFSEAIIVLSNIKPEADVLSTMQKFLIIVSLPFAFFTVLVIILLSKIMFSSKRSRSNKKPFQE